MAQVRGERKGRRRVIVVVDPGLATRNTGDQIISQAVRREFIAPLRAIGADVETVPMHGELGAHQRRLLRMASDVVVCGTNLLSSHMRFRNAWEWPRSDVELARGKATFLGVGWWQYQRSRVDRISRRWMSDLAGRHDWAVRDDYSAAKLTEAGVPAVHVSCPTLWSQSEQLLPGSQRRVVATVTDYNQNPDADRSLNELLSRHFEEVMYWPQGPGDERYLRGLLGPEVALVESSLEAFEAAITVPSTAYVGLRLHGGIHALSMGAPTLILSIDNRAREISKSSGLRVLSRYAIREIAAMLQVGGCQQLAVPREAISAWKRGWGLNA